MTLFDRIVAALDAGAATTTETLQALLLESGGDKCWRRPRLMHLLSHYVLLHSPLPMSQCTTHRFKADFAHADFSGFVLEVAGQTKLVTAHNLADEDVPLLIQYGGGHLIEPLPVEVPEATELAKLKKDELLDWHANVVGEPAPPDATRRELIEAITAGPTDSIPNNV